MRLPTAWALLAIPFVALATHQQSPLGLVKARARDFVNKILLFIPNPNKVHPVDEATSKVAGRQLEILTLDNWEQTIRSSVKPSSTQAEEWWILMTGRNKTCFGLCNGVETAFNHTAALYAINPTAPHMALVNCDDQPVFCNSWGVGPPNLWILQVPNEPAPVDIRKVFLNTTTTTATTFTDLHASELWKEEPLYRGYFHPFDGPIVKYGLAVPLGYILWGFSIVPSWLFMILLSFVSRTVVGNRVRNNPATARPRAPRAAAPGDAR